jgi:hypothetical protein
MQELDRALSFISGGQNWFVTAPQAAIPNNSSMQLGMREQANGSVAARTSSSSGWKTALSSINGIRPHHKFG